MFQVLAWHFKLIFGLLTIAKYELMKSRNRCFKVNISLWTHFRLLISPRWDLGEVEKATFQGLEWYSQLIFGLCSSWKCNLMMSKKRLFKWSPILGTHYLPLDQSKMRLGWSRKRYVSRGRMSLWTHFRPLDHPKMRLGWVRKSNVSRARKAIFSYFVPLD